MTEAWTLAIDFGTSYTTAALIDGRGAEVLEIDGVRRFPSMVVLAGDELVVGMAAVSQQALFPAATEAHPKQLLGVRETVLLGGRPVSLTDAVGTVLHAVGAEARRRRDNRPPDALWLTHPARWDQQRIEALGTAATAAGFTQVRFLPEPVAAAMYYADRNVGDRAHVAVFDLGGGTFDTAILQHHGQGFDLIGPPGGDVNIGGETFDSQLYHRLLEYVAYHRAEVAEELRTSDAPEWRRASTGVLTAAREAKEALSRQTSHNLYLPAPIDLELRVTRPDLEDLITDDVERAVDEFERTIERAGLTPDDLAAYYLTGGGSRIPLVAQRLEERLGRAPSTYDDPKLAVVLGVARLPALQGSGPATVPQDAADTVPISGSPPAPTPVPERAEQAPTQLAPVTAPLPGPDSPPPDVRPPALGPEPGRRSRTPIVAAGVAVVVVVALVIGIVLATSNDGPEGAGNEPSDDPTTDVGDQAPVADDFLGLLNDVRADEGLDPLSENGELAASARVHSTDMSEQGELFHTEALGDSLSIPVDAVGELIGAGPLEQPDQIIEGFLADADSRSQLLDPAFELAGIGVVPQGSTIWVTVQLAQPSTESGTS